ncbi:MAG: phospholipase A1 [Flavobacterium sp.]
MNITYSKNRNIVSFIGTSNLKFDLKPRGIAMFSWSYSIKNNLKGFMQLIPDYREMLIDYNYLEVTAGVGVFLIE